MSLRYFATAMPLGDEASVLRSATSLIERACDGWAPPVRFSSRLYRSLGQVACNGDRHSWVTVEYVQFASLLMRCSERDRRLTVIHESAHAIQMKRDGVDGDHGPRWIEVMRSLGVANPAATCGPGNVDPETRAVLSEVNVRRSLVVRCACDTFILSHQRARNARPLEQTCPRCNLRFVRVSPDDAVRHETHPGT